MALDQQALTELVRSRGIRTELELARVLGYDNAVTLWRIRSGRIAPSADFMARTLAAFPGVSLDSLFRVVRHADD